MEQILYPNPQELLLSTKGNRLVKRGNFDDALKSYDAILEINPKSLKSLFGKARLLLEMKRYAESAQVLDKIIEIDSKNIEALVEKGRIFEEQELLTESLFWYSKAVDLSPHNNLSRKNLGRNLANIREYDKAIKIIDEGLKIDRTDDELLYYKGFVLFKLKHIQEALNCLDLAISVNPNNSNAKFQKFLILVSYDKTEEPFKFLWDTVDEDPNGILSLIEQNLKLYPDNGFFWYIKGVILYDYKPFVGCHESALLALNRAIEINPNSVDAWFYKSNVLARLGRYKEAMDAKKQEISLNKERSLSSGILDKTISEKFV